MNVMSRCRSVIEVDGEAEAIEQRGAAAPSRADLPWFFPIPNSSSRSSAKLLPRLGIAAADHQSVNRRQAAAYVNGGAHRNP